MGPTVEVCICDLVGCTYRGRYCTVKLENIRLPTGLQRLLEKERRTAASKVKINCKLCGGSGVVGNYKCGHCKGCGKCRGTDARCKLNSQGTRRKRCKGTGRKWGGDCKHCVKNSGG